MNRYTAGILTAITAALLIAPARAQKTTEAYTMLEAARQKETQEGDLKGAIHQYGAIVAKYKNDRAVTAMALVRMAEAYQKMGDVESRKIFERVVREYGDQKDAVAMARMRLGGNGQAGNKDGILTRQVWAKAIDTEGAPSPDGKYLSFVDWMTGDLAIRELASGENRRLTNKGPWSGSEDFALYSTFSPDGKQIAYAWYSDKNKENSWDLRIVPVPGGIEVPKPRVLYRNQDIDYIQPAEWSRDGKQILALFTRKDRTNQIAMISVMDGSARILKTFDWRSPTRMSLSPDGRYVAYDFPPKEEAQEREIFVLSVDGSRESKLVEHPADDMSPMWTPDGKRILFTSNRTGSMGIWLIPVVEGKAQGTADLIKAGTGPMIPMGFTSKGGLVYSQRTGDTNVYVAKLDVHNAKTQDTVKSFSERFSGMNSMPDWSPDGRYLAFSSRTAPGSPKGPTLVRIRSLAGGEHRDLRPELSYLGGFRWSPDGQSLIAWASDRKGRKGIYQIDAVTAKMTPVVATGGDFRDPWLSPDGASVYYRDDESGRAVVRDLKTGRERELVPAGRLRINDWAFSRDGKRVAFLSANLEKQSMSILVMSTDGGEPREVITLPDITGRLLEWERDGRGLLYGRGRNSELWRVSAEGGKPEKLDIKMIKMGGIRVHPDGERIAFSSGESGAEVWEMQNFLPQGQK